MGHEFLAVVCDHKQVCNIHMWSSYQFHLTYANQLVKSYGPHNYGSIICATPEKFGCIIVICTLV